MSWHCDSTELLPGAWLTSAYPGAGIRGADVPSSGANGPSDLYPTLTLPADAAVEVSGRTLTVPSAGTFLRQENGEWAFSGAPAGVYIYSFGLYADYGFVGNVTNSITVSASQTDVTFALTAGDATISAALAVASASSQLTIGIVGEDAAISAALSVAAAVQVTIGIVGEDAVISGALSVASANSQLTIGIVGEDAAISAALSVAAATSQITMAVLGEDAVISASLLGGVLPVTPGSAPTSSTASTRHSLKRLVAATDTCVTLAEAKLHCRVDGVLEDFLITAYIQAATEAAEQLTGRAIMPQIWQLTHDGFPALFELTRPNVLSVVSLTYIDAAGATQSLTPADYSLDASDGYGFAYVVPAWDVTWPAAGGQMNSVVLTYQAGYASAAQVPASVKAWVLLMTAALYNTRELEGTQQTHSLGRADVLLDSVKVWSI